MKSIKQFIKDKIYDNYIARYDYGLESRKAMKLVKGYTMSTPIDMATLYELVIHLDNQNIQGDLVECGVWKGGSAGIMALASLRAESAPKRVIHLFDLFDDIVAPDLEKDAGRGVDEVSAFLKKKGKSIFDIKKYDTLTGIYDSHGGFGKVECVREFLTNKIGYPDSKLSFHVGLFQETIPNATGIEKIALLRLDGDWYESTKIPLDHLFDRVVNGGVIIIDDYWTYEGCRHAVDEFMKERSLTYFKCYSRPQTRFFFKTS